MEAVPTEQYGGGLAAVADLHLVALGVVAVGVDTEGLGCVVVPIPSYQEDEENHEEKKKTMKRARVCDTIRNTL